MAQTNTAEAAKAAGAKTPEDNKKPRHHKNDRFEYTTDDGAVLRAKYVENLPYKLAKEFRTIPEEEVQDRIVAEILSPEDVETFDELTIGEVLEFLEQWQEESAISLGEL
ncbi:hypothetical protein V6S67_07905 [Arthrobacter sp. Soc17.1.1.1]|uniref:hypothetical protein n=1 Tax=Arthrobacter sp. Soc17.1.1.1 TaxID=3121277 RepID=UPI002FE4D716